MNIFELEEKRKRLNQKLSEEKSPRYCLLLICDYFDFILSTKDEIIIDSYVPEFLPGYVKFLNLYSPQGLPPGKTERIIETAKNLIAANIFDNDKIKDAIDEIQAKLSLLRAILDGRKNEEGLNLSANNDKRSEDYAKQSLSFPVMEMINDGNVSFGLLESLSVIINKKSRNENDSFEVIPSSRELEEKLERQIGASWNAAIKFVSDKIKLTNNHTVIIKFKNKFGEYVGDSLGVTLTLAFIAELLKTYNAREQIKVSGAAAFTGSLNEKGAVGKVSGEIISRKTETVFFSEAEIFVLPKDDEKAATEKLSELKKRFPKRNLKIIPVETLDDILIRRDLIDIQKQNIILYSAKKAYTPKFAFTFAAAVVLFVAALLYQKFDTNPAALTYSNGYLEVLNKIGDTLWTTQIGAEKQLMNRFQFFHKYYFRIVDVNGDGINEVVLCSEIIDSKKYPDERFKITCYNNKKELIWDYYLTEPMRDRQEEFKNRYAPKILDIVSEPDRKEIIIAAQQDGLYANAVFRLDFKGNRIGKILWHPGGASWGFVKDIDNDGKYEAVVAGINNGFERAVLFSIELDKLNGRSPSNRKYRFPDYEIAEFDDYLLLPRSDYNYQCVTGSRYNLPYTTSYNESAKIIDISLDENTNIFKPITYNILFNNDFSFHKFIIGDAFESERNKKVNAGILKGPLTDSPEYKEILRRQIKYWNGKEFIGVDKWNGKQADPPSPDSKY